MPWTFDFKDNHRLLEVHYEGDFESPELRAVTIHIVTALNEHQTLYLLLDCHNAHFNVATVDVYQLPELYAAQGVSRQTRAAVVLPKDGYHKELFEFYEDVCRNRGYFVQLFDDAAAARAWLKEAMDSN